MTRSIFSAHGVPCLRVGSFGRRVRPKNAANLEQHEKHSRGLGSGTAESFCRPVEGCDRETWRTAGRGWACRGA